MGSADAGQDAAVLDVLRPSEDEARLLACVDDAALHELLLHNLLRAAVGEPVHVQVNARMRESDNGGILRELLANGVYLDATLTAAGGADDSNVSFALRCDGVPQLDRTYEGDDIEDKLLQFFAKDLIRFPRSPPSNEVPCAPALLQREEEEETDEETSEEEADEKSDGEERKEGSQIEGSETKGSDGGEASASVTRPDLASDASDPAMPEACAADHVNFELSLGDRLHIIREDENAATAASIVTISRNGENILFVWDDMMWAGHKRVEVEENMRKGIISRVKEEKDVPQCKRARAMLSPANMAPDCFLFDERTWSVSGATSWRWFGILAPAPEDGTHNQRYSAPRIPCVLSVGTRVTLCGRAARLVPLKRTEARELLCTSTPFTVLGFVQASLPAQNSYWVIVALSEREMKDINIYAATVFGKGAEEVHVTLDAEQPSEELIEGLDAYIQMAMGLLSSRTTSQVNSAIATAKPLTKLSPSADVAIRTRLSNASALGGRREEPACKAPFHDNFELTGVGKSRLMQFNAQQLSAVLKERGVNHNALAQVSQLVAKVEAWKRERASIRRDDRHIGVQDDNKGGASEEDVGAAEVPPAPPAGGRGRKGSQSSVKTVGNNPIAQSGSTAKASTAVTKAVVDHTAPRSAIEDRSVELNKTGQPRVSPKRGQDGERTGSILGSVHNAAHACGVCKESRTDSGGRDAPGQRDTRSRSPQRGSHNLQRSASRSRTLHRRRHRSRSSSRSTSRNRGRYDRDARRHRDRGHRDHGRRSRRSRSASRSSSRSSPSYHRQGHRDERRCAGQHREQDVRRSRSLSRKRLKGTPDGKHTLENVRLPSGWKEAADEKGRIYFYNKRLHKSQYNFPQEDSPPLPPPQSASQQCIISPRRAPPTIGRLSPNVGTAPGQAHSYRVQQLKREHARLRGMLAFVAGERKAELYGELAAIESDLYSC